MQNNDQDKREKSISCPSSRIGSAGSQKSMKNAQAKKKSPVNSAPVTAYNTPKKSVKTAPLDLFVTGKKILNKADRANSLPGTCRRPKDILASGISRKCVVSRNSVTQTGSHDTSLESDLSIDLSQMSEYEDANSKCFKQRVCALATSTPKPRSASVASQPLTYRVSEPSDLSDSASQSTRSVSPLRQEESSSSSSTSPRSQLSDGAVVSPSSVQGSASSNMASWAKTDVTKVDERPEGEWRDFWSNYNRSLGGAGVPSYYDQCPTPFRTENIDLADFDLTSETSRLRSPVSAEKVQCIIRREGLKLTARETQSLVKCAHILGGVLARAVERNARQQSFPEPSPNPDLEIKKKNLTLQLSPETLPIPVKVNVVETATTTTQTDISLPFTKSAPRIFEKILRQLSRSSIDEVEIKAVGTEEKKEDGNKTI